MSKRNLAFLTALTVLLAALPYIIAAQSGGGDFIFNGFLLNPLDGNSYLAKMREGWSGSWQFGMLFSSQAPEGSYLFLFYLFLGHVARIAGLPVVLVFHLARIISVIVLCLVLYRFVESFLREQPNRIRTIAFVLLLFGSGFGWLAALFGGFTADFWVAEAYPFLSIYSNPHFPLALALLLDFFVQLRQTQKKKINLRLLLNGLLTGLLMPFAVVLAAVVAGGVQLWELLKRENPIRWWLINYFIPGGLVLLYQFQSIRSDPVLSAWNAQNLTLSPPFWDMLISFSPALILAAVVIAYLHRQNKLADNKLLIVWLIAGLVLAYFPFQLQRRFLLGFYIPAASLGAIGLGWAFTNPKRLVRIGAGILLGFSLLTNLLVIAGGMLAVKQNSPDLFYPGSLQRAFDWMLVNKPACDVTLSAPETGLILPGATGWRVAYGHPYETPNADMTKADVARIFSPGTDESTARTLVAGLRADFLLIGPNEMKAGSDLRWLESYPVRYENEDVSLYQVRDCP